MFFSIFQVFFAFHAISTLKKKIGVKKIKINPGGGGGGGGVDLFIFLEKQFFLISLFMLFSTLKKYIEKCPFTYWLNGRWFLQIVDIHVANFNMKLTGRWFPQIVDRDSGNLYPIYMKQKLWC